MRCPTMEVNRDGQKVIINTCDFDVKTMVQWGKIPVVSALIDSGPMVQLGKVLSPTAPAPVLKI